MLNGQEIVKTQKLERDPHVVREQSQDQSTLISTILAVEMSTVKEALGLDVLSNEGESSIAKLVVPILCTVDVLGRQGIEGEFLPKMLINAR